MSKTAATYRFPLKPFLANGIALWLMCAVLHELHLFVFPVFQMKGYWTGFIFLLVLYLVFATVQAAFYFVLSLFPQLVFFHLFKAKIRKKVWWWIIFLSPFVLFASYHLYLTAPTVRSRAILANANLASLPKSAQDIYVHKWSSPFSGEEYLRFQAEPKDIQQFVENSPILKNINYNIYTKDRMRLYKPTDYPFNLEDVNNSHEYFLPHHGNPDWYKEEIKGPGRRYEIQPEGYYCPGEVIIDDENNIVYVKLVFS